MEETLSNRICRPAGDVCAVLHINWQQSSRNAWLEIPQRAPGMTSPRSRMPGDLGISPPSRLNYSTRNSFLQCWALSRLLCNSVSIQQTSVLSTQNPPSLVHGWVLCPQGARTTRADLSQGLALSWAQGLWTPRLAFFTGPHPPGWFETAHPWLPTTWMTFTGPHLYPVQRCFLTFPCCLVLPP